MAKNNEKNITGVKTVGQLKKFLENCDNEKSLADLHIKIVKPKIWKFNILFENAKICADTEDEAYDEIVRIVKEFNIFPQSEFDIDDIEEIA